MKCVKIRELLPDYLRQDIDPKTTAAVTGHLGICDDCARELAFLKAYFTKIGSLEKMEAPDNLLVDIHQRLNQMREPESKPRFSRLWVGRMPRIAGALTVALILLTVFNPFQIGQRLRRDAKLQPALQIEKNKAATEESKEITTLGSNAPQSKNAPAPVAENRSGFVTGSTAGVDSQTRIHAVEERRLIITIRQPALMAKQVENTLEKGIEDKSAAGAGGTDQIAAQEEYNKKSEQREPATDSAMISTVRTFVKSVGGEIVGEEVEDGETGLPGLLVRIPVQNYASFIKKLQDIGSVNGVSPDVTPAPGQSNSQQFIETKLILKGVF